MKALFSKISLKNLIVGLLIFGLVVVCGLYFLVKQLNHYTLIASDYPMYLLMKEVIKDSSNLDIEYSDQGSFVLQEKSTFFNKKIILPVAMVSNLYSNYHAMELSHNVSGDGSIHVIPSIPTWIQRVSDSSSPLMTLGDIATINYNNLDVVSHLQQIDYNYLHTLKKGSTIYVVPYFAGVGELSEYGVNVDSAFLYDNIRTPKESEWGRLISEDVKAKGVTKGIIDSTTRNELAKSYPDVLKELESIPDFKLYVVEDFLTKKDYTLEDLYSVLDSNLVTLSNVSY